MDATFTAAAPGPLTSRRRAWVISSWQNGKAISGLLGVAGYSYDFLARLYLPLLRRLGEVIWIGDPGAELEPSLQRLRERDLDPVHVTFAPFQCATFARSAPNILVLAWEFPQIPDHEFDGNPQNNWIATAERCALVIVASPFTERALVRGGVRAPVRVVPAPVADCYFQLEPWHAGQRVVLDCHAHVLQQPEATAQANNFGIPAAPNGKAGLPRMAAWKSAARKACRMTAKAVLPARLLRVAAAAVRAARAELASPVAPCAAPTATTRVELTGVVYTCVINPDGRKNWEDLITGFVLALRDCPAATLVIKLATNASLPIQQVLGRCRSLGIAHLCKIVVISEYLSDAQMLELTRASTYYLTTTRAEGICLPLMDFLAAGRPGISPRHTALADYFGPEAGFVVDSHPEPIAFPHDHRLRLLTFWQRIVWSSLVEQIRQSYATAKAAPEKYESLSRCGRETIRRWAGAETVQPLLEGALAMVPCRTPAPGRAA